MEKLDLEKFTQQLKEDLISPYQIYNLDIDYPAYFSIKHYINHPEDDLNKDQKLHILFLDIEVFVPDDNEFPEIVKAKYPINAITIYDTFEKIYTSYFLINHDIVNKFPASKEEIFSLQEDYKKYLLNEGYITNEEQIKINVFVSELELIKSCWENIKNLDPCILSGYNCDEFDLPYIYFRLSNLTNKNEYEIGRIMSKFGHVRVEKYNNRILINIPEFAICDLLYLYKVREDGGLNYGSKQSSYSLDWVANDEIGLSKKSYKEEGLTLNQFYKADPVNFLLYNIIDVTLVKNLNEKLKHIESHNLLRRFMKTSFSRSLSGSSVLFDTYINYQLQKENKYVRFGLNSESVLAINSEEIEKIYRPKSFTKWTIESIDVNMYRKILGRYSGAYVKDSKMQILNAKDGIILDLDASSLYPSTIIQTNISFDTFFGRIIDPCCYTFINTLNNCLESGKFPEQIYIVLLDKIIKYVNQVTPQNKTEYTQYLYLISAYLVRQLEISKLKLKDIINPTSLYQYQVLRRYLMPLLEIIEEIHPDSREYNKFAYDYLLNHEIKLDYIYIIENILQPSAKIVKVVAKQFENYLKNNHLILSLSGCLFYKHEVKTGIFIDFLKRLKDLRNEYESKRNQHPEDSYEYNFYNMRQNAIKVTMNTTYGLYGQSTYRFSNSHLAHTITTQSRLMLKIAQIIGEMYLNQYKTNLQ